MKNKFFILIMILWTMLLIGCAAEDSGLKHVDIIPSSEIQLTLNEPVEVFPGDALTPQTEDTKINVLHTLGESTKVVTLLQGNAVLLRGNYSVQ